ncbi:glucosaminephosphotransferase, putative [Entamoeba dispar SAW760]|uniref:UDP-N-acetylglucosamine--dolichyl-phosphate N-acetylglucosaminephosphotransferase n=1 Tax=Entamoeba dispar (strain ATCC PRA-260 / SAW760) TaxID=370354 RepID=B0EHT8_ENTDS|nr:glucosaminephosphotransferase, putative [Entamoeba dispar SAW760]EDR25882.1 glucosaminephosphotransferase, putative [Entamoeba dispar SAW760]|eukprot:EDR25882.1 glucosaminephosphotransferase, putative [Entamoeba dispar SAW760]
MKLDAFYCGVFGLIILTCLLPFKESFNDLINCGILIGFSFVGGIACYYLIPHMGNKCIQKGLFGLDINKGTQDKIPESMGLVCGIVFMFITMLFSSLISTPNYIISLLVILFNFIIGLIDDFLDIRWRYKLILSFCSSMLIVIIYPGSCTLFGINLSIIYLFGLICLSVFFTNSINMFAGVNGLESGQCIIISVYSILHNIIILLTTISSEQYKASLLSLYLLIPFLFVTIVLFYYNKFPSKVFVGDSFTYFSGGVLGVASIIGGYDRLMFCLFFPEFINFFVSIPQLFGFIYCPRHRLPKLNKETHKLECVTSHHTLLNLILFIVGPKTEHELVNIAFIFHTITCGIVMVLAYFVFPTFFLDSF